MLALASFAAALLSTALGWVLMVVLPAAVFIGIPASLFVPPGETLVWTIAKHAAALGLLLLSSIWLGYRLCPVPLRMRRLFPGSSEHLVDLWVAPDNIIQAYALPGLGQGAVVLSSAAALLPADEKAWVIAHERSHLHRGDADAMLWRTAGAKTLRLGVRLAWMIHRIACRLPLIRGCALLYYRLALYSVRLSYTVFLLFDRHIGRAMEYRADLDAARATSPLAGIKVLQRLQHPLEPHLNLFASHPPCRRRIARLAAMVQHGERID